METLYNVFITILVCLLKTLKERFPRQSEEASSVLMKHAFKTKYIEHVSGILTSSKQIQFRYVMVNLLLKIIKTGSVFVLKNACLNLRNRTYKIYATLFLKKIYARM